MASGPASRASRIALGVLVVAAPAIATVALLDRLFGATLLDYFPLVSDEIAYQRQIAAFVEAGFHSGYFTAYERPAPFALSHFSVHGPAFPVLYGLVGRVVGWHLYSGPIFNLGVLALAIAIFLLMARLSPRQIALTGAVILTSWWVLLMASITMQESLNQAFLIVMAGCAARLMQPETTRRWPLLLGALVVLAVASVLRPTNWIVAVPLVLAGMSWQRPIRVILATVAAGLGIPLFWLLWRYVSAPIPDLAIEWSPATGKGAVALITDYFFDHLQRNAAIFDLRQFFATPFFQHVMFECVVIALVCAVLSARSGTAAWTRRSETSSAAQALVRFKVDLFNLLTLGLALVAFLGFYFDSEASISRVTAPFVLMSLLLLVAMRSRGWIVAIAVAAQILVAPSFVSTYRAWRTDLFPHHRARYELFRTQLTPWLTFAPLKPAWCNTLLTTTYAREIVGVPDGIGLSIGSPSTQVASPIKSGYLLVTADNAEDLRQRVRLRHLATTVLGELYANDDAACE